MWRNRGTQVMGGFLHSTSGGKILRQNRLEKLGITAVLRTEAPKKPIHYKILQVICRHVPHV